MPTTRFKIVDSFRGAKGGALAFFGICDEDRDRRRFATVQEAEETIEADEWNAPEPKYDKPPEDKYGRRFMNLIAVPEDHRWCFNAEAGRWKWQQPIAFDFDGPMKAGEVLSYWVDLDGMSIGLVRTDAEGRRWTAERSDRTSITGEFNSGYAAALALVAAAR